MLLRAFGFRSDSSKPPKGFAKSGARMSIDRIPGGLKRDCMNVAGKISP